MENTLGTGKRLTADELASLLRDAAAEISKKPVPGSFEGSITWETPAEDFDQRFEVLAFYRVGNDMGQGGAVVVRGDLG